MAANLILGTAGHIDHGKTALVRALTGVDTDRLPEEKRRGITIELGFAELDLGDFLLGIVDVPGHEKFVRTMLAGATGIDVALLVVAADDSVKQQTREHLEILRLLNLRRGVIALTKCDIADPEWLELVEADVREFVADTFLENAPLIRTSALKGDGIDELKKQLTIAARETIQEGPANRTAGPFRMPIDRTFTIAGHGTVVTGSVVRGQTAVGDELVIQPGDIKVRVRGLQNHSSVVDELGRGQRAAVNLAGVHHDQVGRGHELASPGHLKPTRLLTVELELLPSAPRPLKNRRRVRVHLGTAEMLSSVSLYGCDELVPGGKGLAQLFLREPAVATWGQPLVIRSESPVITIGGGRVLSPDARKIRRNATEDWAQVERLGSDSELTRAASAVYLNRWNEWQPDDLARIAGADDPQQVYDRLLDADGVVQQIKVSPTRTARIHSQQIQKLCDNIVAALERLHTDNPREPAFPASRLANQFRYLDDAAVYKSLVKLLVQQDRIQVVGDKLAAAGQGPQLSKSESKLLTDIVSTYRAAGRQPPSVAEVVKTTPKNQAAVPDLIRVAESQGELIRLTDELFIHRDAESEIRQQMKGHLAGTEGLTVSQIRELLQTTRKYAIPLCEYFDRTGFTRRQGDLRVLAE